MGLGVGRAELEEARMLEAAMMGIPYEPRLPSRCALPSGLSGCWPGLGGLGFKTLNPKNLACRPSGGAAPLNPVVAEARGLRWEQDQAYEDSLAADRCGSCVRCILQVKYK